MSLLGWMEINAGNIFVGIFAVGLLYIIASFYFSLLKSKREVDAKDQRGVEK